ncbi:MAG: type II toxin-antitoxin system VapC family toxin [Comamonadaceae bacterium]|nr:type II toxin-antitoxin system VapC family toxin [Comamonadaceae bacterium]
MADLRARRAAVQRAARRRARPHAADGLAGAARRGSALSTPDTTGASSRLAGLARSSAPRAAAFVLDASVALGAFFEDEQDAYSLAVLAVAGRRAVPACRRCGIWRWATSSPRAERAGRITPAALDERWQRVEVRRAAVAAGRRRRPRTGRSAPPTGASRAYDACYLDTALQQRLPLATQGQAAGRHARAASASRST